MTPHDQPAALVRAGFAARVCVAVLLALVLAIVVQVATADGPDAVSGRLGGDYPSFHAVGEVWLDDPWPAADRLYEPDRQFRAQEPLLPSDRDGNLYFAYPAFFAAPYVALAALPFVASYLLHVVLMTAAVVVALVLVRPLSRTVRAHPLETATAAITFFPLFRGVTGGQNTALSLLLVVVFWRSLEDRREVGAGVAAALLLFKPPLALPFLGALVLGRHVRGLIAAAVTSVALYLLGAVVAGPAWPSAWVDAVRYLDRVDTPFNVENFVSLPGVAEAVFGVDSPPATVIGFSLAAAVAVAVAWVWVRGRGDVGGRIAVTTAGALLISPHALYYDAGLLMVVALVILDRRPDLRWVVAVAWLAGFTHLLSDALGASPLVAVVVAAFAVSWVTLNRRAPRPSPAPAGRQGAS